LDLSPALSYALVHAISARYLRGESPSGQPVISFEFFPPKTPEGDRALLEKTIPALLETRPDYCSVTYGAGVHQGKDFDDRRADSKGHGLTAVAHLTCVCATQQQIADLLAEIRSLGIKNVLALRGDPPPALNSR
jgi:methylenetetrahydrofolate reductase (NADPH)